MTRVTGQAIPPSLLAPYLRLLRTMQRHDYTDPSVQLYGGIHYPRFVDTRSIARQRARIAAAWLGDRWATGLSARGRQDFETERVTEILSRSFPAPYWVQAALGANDTQSFAPTCSLDPGGVAPAYQDPNRQASWCVYRKNATTYPDPAPQTLPPNPSAGWSGDVQSTVFEDRWFAQLVYGFDFGTNVRLDNGIPVWADVSYTIDANASFRGNKFWGSVTIAPIHSYRLYHFTDALTLSRAFLQNYFAWRFPVPSAATPWSYSFSRAFALDLKYADSYRWGGNGNFFTVYIAPIPAHGRYFARNDSVTCWLTASVNAYRATGP